MSTFQELAVEMSKAFEGATRSNGEEYRRLRDGHPEWMKEVSYEAHGDMLPDDWRYTFIERAVDCFADLDDEDDDLHEYIDSAVDVYNGRLLQWVSSNLSRAGYVDEQVSELGYPGDLFKSLQYGQFAEIQEVFEAVRTALKSRAE